jgi:hypothetical protein
MSRAIVQIKCKADRNLIERWANNVPEGTTVEFRAPRRSIDQNALDVVPTRPDQQSRSIGTARSYPARIGRTF